MRNISILSAIISWSILVCMFPIISIGCASSPKISGLNDPLEDKVALSSQSFSTPFVLASEQADPFIRGWIDKRLKTKSHQLYISVNSGSDFANWSQVAYLKDGKRIEVEAKRIGYDVKASEYGVVHYEDIVVDLSESDIEWFATQEQTTIRLISHKTTKKIDFVLDGAEAQSYLETVKEAMVALTQSGGGIDATDYT